MNMKEAPDADRLKKLIDAAAHEKFVELQRLADGLRDAVDEYVRNAGFVASEVGSLFEQAAFFGVKEIDLADDRGYRNEGPTFAIGGIDLKLEGTEGHSTRHFAIRASHHASGERERSLEIPKGRYRVVLALMPVKE